MTPEQRAAMYQSQAEEDELENEVPTEEGETKLANVGGGMVQIAVGDKMATVPTIAYTKMLEKKIVDLQREIRNQINANRRLSVSLNQVIKSVNELSSQLDNKLDKPF